MTIQHAGNTAGPRLDGLRVFATTMSVLVTVALLGVAWLASRPWPPAP